MTPRKIISTPLTPLFVLSQLLTDRKVSLFSTFLKLFHCCFDMELEENLEKEEEDEFDQKVQEEIGGFEPASSD